MRFDADGSRSLGLSTNVLPVAIAIGCIHIGTITGKLNGVMPAHTPSGWRNEYASTSVETCSEYSPLSTCGMPQANSTTSMPRMTSPLASESTLPCSSATMRGELVEVAVHQFAEREHDPGPADQRHVPPAVERLAGGLHRGVHVGRFGQQHLGLLPRRWPGSTPAPRRADAPVVSAPPIQCSIVLTSLSSHRWLRWLRGGPSS